MSQHITRLQKIRFYASSAAIYGLTVLFAVMVVRPLPSVSSAQKVANARPARPYVLEKKPEVNVIAGRPVRLVLPASQLDLSIDPGYYDSASDTWTLSGYRAQFAMMSAPANNQSGATFVYGHNNNTVFGALRHRTPELGEKALVYTDNGHVFSYSFTAVSSVGPNDTSALNFSGPARLTIQTCTGSLNEWRTMFQFKFESVVQ